MHSLKSKLRKVLTLLQAYSKLLELDKKFIHLETSLSAEISSSRFKALYRKISSLHRPRNRLT
jgi:hypothetical protein